MPKMEGQSSTGKLFFFKVRSTANCTYIVLKEVLTGKIFFFINSVFSVSLFRFFFTSNICNLCKHVSDCRSNFRNLKCLKNHQNWKFGKINFLPVSTRFKRNFALLKRQKKKKGLAITNRIIYNDDIKYSSIVPAQE